MAAPPPDAERARRTTGRLLWGCAALTVMVGVFQLADILREIDQYGALAWLGVVVAAVAELALIAAYVACALERMTLRQRVVGQLDVFQVSAGVFLIALVAGVLSPGRNTTTLALLLPFAITYWLHGLEAAGTESASSDEP